MHFSSCAVSHPNFLPALFRSPDIFPQINNQSSVLEKTIVTQVVLLMLRVLSSFSKEGANYYCPLRPKLCSLKYDTSKAREERKDSEYMCGAKRQQ